MKKYERNQDDRCRDRLNGDAAGNDIVIFTGEARIVAEAPPAHQIPAFVKKYHEDLRAVPTAEAFARTMGDYSVALRVTPTGLRGF